MTVNKERVQLLVDALRSGEYKQGRGQLRTPDERYHCCLGVATQVALDHGLEVEDTVDRRDKGQPWDQAHQVMCPPVAQWYGFESGNPVLVGSAPNGAELRDVASHWNDDFESTFPQIADMLENTYLREAASA